MTGWLERLSGRLEKLLEAVSGRTGNISLPSSLPHSHIHTHTHTHTRVKNEAGKRFGWRTGLRWMLVDEMLDTAMEIMAL